MRSTNVTTKDLLYSLHFFLPLLRVEQADPAKALPIAASRGHQGARKFAEYGTCRKVVPFVKEEWFDHSSADAAALQWNLKDRDAIIEGLTAWMGEYFITEEEATRRGVMKTKLFSVSKGWYGFSMSEEEMRDAATKAFAVSIHRMSAKFAYICMLRDARGELPSASSDAPEQVPSASIA